MQEGRDLSASRAVYAWEGGRIPPLRFISGGGSLASPLRK